MHRYFVAATNLLHDIDKEVQSVVKDIMQHQNDAAGGAPGLICFGQDMPTLRLLDPVRCWYLFSSYEPFASFSISFYPKRREYHH